MQFQTRFRAMHAILAFTTVTLFVISTADVKSDIIFQDGFETGDMSHSENGFRWLSPNRASVVRDDQCRVWAGGSTLENDCGYEGRQWENGPATPGRHALRFYYPSGQAMSEQRFNLGGVYPELWMSYWIRVPVNYVHGNPVRPGRGYRNQKFSAVWTDKYSGSGQPVVVFNFWDDRNAWNEEQTAGSSYSTVSISNRTNGPSNHRARFNDFIHFPEDQGRWMHVVSRFKIASYRGAEDGIVQWWRRWSDESDYTLIADLQTEGIGTDTGPAGFTAGYLMGWANGAYTEDTEFLIDDFTVATTSLLAPGAAHPNSPDPIAVR